ncbi:hypothetical protein [Robiginitomaculum antarcticum]|uniref:hypothetical protein n=1 Tax=Robiginitomaculum antarcticum TaxID=437507 RepID=UPI0003825522|nr:hypothetical protein [Robiginitomaculum antarcticum]
MAQIIARPKDNLSTRKAGRRLRSELMALKLKHNKLAYAQTRRAQMRLADEALDYDDPALDAARARLVQFRIDAEIDRIDREITGYMRNGGQPPTPAQRETAQEREDERRTWEMIEAALRAKSAPAPRRSKACNGHWRAWHQGAIDR